MEAEKPSLPNNREEAGDENPLTETMVAIIRAIEQVNLVNSGLFQALEQQVVEVETLKIEMKQRKDIPKPLKKMYNEQLYWWSGMSGQTKEYQEQFEGYQLWLENAQETCRKNLSAFKQLREEIGKLSLR